jgi:hypothetical protein
MLASNSPELFAGNRVLLRLCVPRYPPSALISLTTFAFSKTQNSLAFRLNIGVFDTCRYLAEHRYQQLPD